jgi:hypothetical protein
MSYLALINGFLSGCMTGYGIVLLAADLPCGKWLIVTGIVWLCLTIIIALINQ